MAGSESKIEKGVGGGREVGRDKERERVANRHTEQTADNKNG